MRMDIAIAGWNIGPAAYGYPTDRVPHPARGSLLAATTDVPDPARIPWSTI
jgi:hypothetical protein